ncbi:MAG TPA: hypothetical protein DCP71_09625, partial [Verrucomicrobiales bacterium]|nr:hypothetical protein [Verrucomicrobiales bacterium]
RELEALDQRLPGRIHVVARWREAATPMTAADGPVAADITTLGGGYGAVPWQQRWTWGNGVMGMLGYGLYDLALAAACPARPIHIFATGDHAAWAAQAPSHVLVISRHADWKQLTWLHSPHLTTGVPGITVKDAAGKGIYQMTAAELAERWHSPVALPQMWQHLISNAAAGAGIAVPLAALGECNRSWLAAKAALMAGRALDFTWDAAGFPL